MKKSGYNSGFKAGVTSQQSKITQLEEELDFYKSFHVKVCQLFDENALAMPVDLMKESTKGIPNQVMRMKTKNSKLKEALRESTEYLEDWKMYGIHGEKHNTLSRQINSNKELLK